MAQSFNCPSCGAPLDVKQDSESTMRCPYCNASVIVPETLRANQPAGNFSSIPGVADTLAHAKELAEVARLARSNQEIEAIKLYRQITGASLMDAKGAVEAIERGEPVQLPSKVTYSTARAASTHAAYSPTPVGPRRKASTGIVMAAFIITLLGLTLGINLIRQPTQSPAPAATQVEQPYTGAGVFTKAADTIKTEAVALLEPTRSFGDATLLLSFGAKGIGQGQLQDARSIAVDSDGAIYVGEYEGGRIEVFDPEGKFSNQWNTGDRKSPLVGLAVNSQDTVSAAQAGDLLLFNGETGEAVKQIKEGGTGSHVDHLFPTSDGGYALITSGEDLWLFNPQGKQTLHITAPISQISGNPELDTSVAVDGEGAVYLLGHFSNAVFKYSPAGKYVDQFGTAGNQPGQFQAPEDIAVDGQGRVYISDIKGVQIFNQSGNYLGLIKVDGAAFGMAVDNQDNLYIITNHPTIYKFKVTVKP